MAQDAKAVEITIPWEQEGERGYAKIAWGTMQFLGLNPPDSDDLERTYQLNAKTISRKLYPGGPTLTYQRPAQTITRTPSGVVSTAKSNNKIILKTTDSQDTVYFTGPRPYFVRWLKENANNPSTPVQMRGNHGNPLGILGLKDGNPLTPNP